MRYGIEFLRIVAVILIAFTHTRNTLDEGFFYTLFEVLPPYGTAVLSVISGFLYWDVSRRHKTLFPSKVKSLAIPYLIANSMVIIVVCVVYYFFGLNPLNRLDFDYTLITEGLLSLNSAPVSPPTYFVRDIFMLFVLIELVKNKNYWMLLILIPVVIWGKLFIRLDVVFLFVLGLTYGAYRNSISKINLLIVNLLLIAFVAVWFSPFLKFPIALLIFVLFVDVDFKFYKTGRYSYLLHLYHSPIIVATFPLLNKVVTHPVLSVVSQVLVAMLAVYFLFFLSKKISVLKILSGGR